MKNLNDKGFSLVETLVVTIFIATVLIFLFIQFSNLSSSYEESFKYNSVEALYALDDIKDYILSDSYAYKEIETELSTKDYIDIKDCSFFDNKDYCIELFKLENIEEIFITTNMNNYSGVFSESEYGEDFNDFIKKISKNGNEPYRIIASFKNDTYATIRFGEYNE